MSVERSGLDSPGDGGRAFVCFDLHFAEGVGEARAEFAFDDEPVSHFSHTRHPDIRLVVESPDQTRSPG
jgi:hypothetical protein